MNGRPRRNGRISARSSRPGIFSLAILAICLLAALGIGVSAVATRPAFAAEVPTPPAPSRWVTDGVGFLSPDTRGRIDAQLESYERSTGHQVLVWIGSTVGDDAVEDWTIRTFTAWKVGRKGIDDGLVLFVFSDDRKVRVEVGYGLEERVPDIVANRIIQDRILPKIRAGDRDGAIAEGVAGLIAAIEGGAGAAGGLASGADDGSATPERPAVQRESEPLSLGQKILYTLIAIGILIFVITHPQLAFWLLLQILSGSSGGGGGGRGGGGGGWSGGGGRGGGGGATGSW